MSGPKSAVQYTSDDGTVYKISIPSWEAALQTTTPATTQPPLPRGYHRRHRMVRYNDTGKEERVTVVLASSTIWTNPAGTAVIVPEPPGSTPPGTANATLQGAIGERRLVRL